MIKRLAILFMILLTTNSVAAADCRDVTSRVDKLNSILNQGMQKHHIPGASIAVVYRNTPCYVHGYGKADLWKNIPASRNTLFGISSLSKTFTAAAIVDLIVNGKLTPDQNAEDFYPLSVEGDLNNTKVTIASLLTHTPGLDDQTIGISAYSVQDLIPLQKYLSEQMPPRVRPSNFVSSYSNHGYALLGGILEKITKRPFADHLRDRIFVPAGMTRTGFEQPLPSQLEQARAIAYAWNGREFSPVQRIYFNDFPASGMFTTAQDMAEFLLSLFEGRKNRGTDFGFIWHQMREQRFTNHPKLPGLTFGFSERRIRGIRILQQGGDWQDYSSFLAILPDAQLGLFFAFNTADGAPVAEQALELFIKKPSQAQAHLAPRKKHTRLMVEGIYRLNRYSRTTMAKIGILVGAIPEVTVIRDGDGLVSFGSRWIPTKDELVFSNERTGSLLAFRMEQGTVTHLLREQNPYIAYEKIALYESASFQRYLFVAMMLIFIVALFVLLVRRGKSRAEIWLRLALSANLLFTTALLAAFAATDPWDFQFGVPPQIKTILLASYAIPIFSGVAVYHTVRRVMRKEGKALTRIVFVFLMLTLIAFIFFLNGWQIFGLRA